MTYVCPMHPEVEDTNQGQCPKCGMSLVVKTADSQKQTTNDTHAKSQSWKSYMPLLVVIGFIFITTLALSYRDLILGSFSFVSSLSYFMIGFFLTFSAFKLMDLSGFAKGYATYDLLAKKWYPYGYIYPFIELFFGLSMILSDSILILWLEVLVMTFSGIGVLLKLVKRERFQCSCLGTFLKVPLTKVTLIEDFGMAFLALLMLFLLN